MKLRDKLTVTLSKTLPIADPTKIYRMQNVKRRGDGSSNGFKSLLIKANKKNVMTITLSYEVCSLTTRDNSNSSKKRDDYHFII